MRDGRLPPKRDIERDPAIVAANAQLALYKTNQYQTAGAQTPTAYTMKAD
jgi:hypothetical protein